MARKIIITFPGKQMETLKKYDVKAEHNAGIINRFQEFAK